MKGFLMKLEVAGAPNAPGFVGATGAVGLLNALIRSRNDPITSFSATGGGVDFVVTEEVGLVAIFIAGAAAGISRDLGACVAVGNATNIVSSLFGVSVGDWAGPGRSFLKSSLGEHRRLQIFPRSTQP